MGNFAFRHLSVSLLRDDEIEHAVGIDGPVTAALLRSEAAKLASGHPPLAHHPRDFVATLSLRPASTEFLCIKLGKAHRLQLQTLFRACKRATESAIADAQSSANAAPAPLPRVPVLCVRIVVAPLPDCAGLGSAYMAADKPFPTRARHTWVWEPLEPRNRTVSRRDTGGPQRTVGHQNRDLSEPDLNPMLPAPRDLSLGASGCIFDMRGHETGFFACQNYFLTLNAAPNASPTAAPCEVTVTASVQLRTMPPPKDEAAKALAAKQALLSAEQQAARAAAAAVRAEAEKNAAAELAAKKEAQRLLDEAAEQKRKQEETAAAEIAAAAAAARAQRALAEAQALSNAEDDPFASSQSASPRHSHAQRPAAEEDDPFGDLSRSSTVHKRADAGGRLDDDPFASMPPTPVPQRNADAAAADFLDEVDRQRVAEAAAASTAASLAGASLARPAGVDRRPTFERVESLERRAALEDALARAGASMPRPPALSPNLLEELPSRRPSRTATPVGPSALSLASTPINKPVKKDLTVLDHLPSLAPPVRVHHAPPSQQRGSTLTRADLSVPLSSLPDRPAPRVVDVLSSAPAPPPKPRAPGPVESLTAQSTPVLRPKVAPQPAVLDAVQPRHPSPARPDARALDHLPPRPTVSLASDLDAVALPALSLAAPIRAAPVGPQALEQLIDADQQARRARVMAMQAQKPARGAPLQPVVASTEQLRAPSRPQPAGTVLDDSSDSLFGSSYSSPARAPAPAAVLDDAFFDAAPMSLPTPAAAPVAASSVRRPLPPPALRQPSRPVTAQTLDELFADEARPAAPAVDFNILDSL